MLKIAHPWIKMRDIVKQTGSDDQLDIGALGLGQLLAILSYAQCVLIAVDGIFIWLGIDAMPPIQTIFDKISNNGEAIIVHEIISLDRKLMHLKWTFLRQSHGFSLCNAKQDHPLGTPQCNFIRAVAFLIKQVAASLDEPRHGKNLIMNVGRLSAGQAQTYSNPSPVQNPVGILLERLPCRHEGWPA
jgi:hypothetical protein